VSEATISAEALASPSSGESVARRSRPRFDRKHAFSAPPLREQRREARQSRGEFLPEFCRAADTAVAIAAIAGALWLAGPVAAGGGLSWMDLAILSIVAVGWRLLFLAAGQYEGATGRSWREELPSVAAASLVGLILLAPIATIAGTGTLLALAAAYPILLVGTIASRAGLRAAASRSAARAPSRVLIVGTGPLALNLHRCLAEQGAAYHLVGFVDSAPYIRFGEVADRFLGTLSELESILMHTVVDEVLIALPVKSHYDEVQRAIALCEQAGVQARFSADIFRSSVGSLRYRPSGTQPAVAVQVAPDDYRLWIKRAIDILGAGIGLLLLLPFLLLVAVAIKVTSPGPVFFSQERFGWRKRRFKILKFRTMVANAAALHASLEARNEATGPVFKIRNDPRVTRIGSFLRRTSIDELPQLWNVLRGEMSLVGPRPLAVRDVSLFEESWLMRRFSVVPGMTGLWQVSGRSNVNFHSWAELDLEYIDKWSLRLDLGILLKTFPAVTRGVGAH
jgi:exopolysaccharide biosynthesis polyprenyl glycosylphosphotransferase